MIWTQPLLRKRGRFCRYRESATGKIYNKITLTAKQKGGFTKASGALNMNFLIVDKNSAIQFQKHTVSKIISPDQNQTADAWKFGYRTVGIAECKDNKKAGIYVHTVKTAA